MITKIWPYLILCLILIASIVSQSQPEDFDERIDLSPSKPTAAVGIQFGSEAIAKRGHVIVLIRFLYLPIEVGKYQWIGVIRIPAAFIAERRITLYTSHQKMPYALPYKTLAEGIGESVKSEWGLRMVGLSTEEVAKDENDGFKYLQIQIPVTEIMAHQNIEHWLSIEIGSLGHDEIIYQVSPGTTELKIMTTLEIDRSRNCWGVWEGFCQIW